MGFFREEIVKRVTRSNGWSKVRKIHLKKFPVCCVCNKKKGLEVHHIMPFHLVPERELDPLNLITMCRRHHFALGHLEYWRAYNSDLIKTVEYFKNLILRRIV